MSKYISLNPAGLVDSFDSEVYGGEPIVSVEEKENRIELSYTFPGFSMSDVTQDVDDETMPFNEVGISGAGFLSKSGKPLLPSFGRYIQIPPGCDYEINVKKNAPVIIKDVVITPAQENATDDEYDTDEFEFNRAAYSKDSYYPSKVVKVSDPQNLNDYKVLLIHVRPLRYNASKKMLKGYANIFVTIKFSPASLDSDESNEYLLSDPEANREGYGNLVMNPGRTLNEFLRPGLPSTIIKPIWPVLWTPEFLIIYDKNLKTPAKLLAKWKRKRGIKTQTVSINTVGNSAYKIKKYIRGRRKLAYSRLRYVLLFGDVGKIVTEEVGSKTTDHYYFTSKDPSHSSECLLPWISGGRIPVQTKKEGKDVVNQIIRYEKSPPCDREYYRRMTFAAYFQDDHPKDGRADRAYMKTMEGIRSHMLTQGFDIDRVYVSNNPNPMQYKDGTAVPQSVKDTIVDGETATDMLISNTSEGQLIIGHRDHGGTSGWSHPRFISSHLNGIQSEYPSIFYSINCLTGRFDANPQDSFAESILAMKGGAPSVIAATELSGTWRNDSLMKAMFDAMWPGMIPSFPGTTASYAIKNNRLGDILNYAKSYLPIAHGNTGGVKAHFEMYHVIGDPTLELWSSPPIVVRVYARVYGNLLNIRLTSCPKGSFVTVWRGSKLIKEIRPSSTRMTVSLKDIRMNTNLPAVRRMLTVCFSAPGHQFAQVHVRY